MLERSQEHKDQHYHKDKPLLLNDRTLCQWHLRGFCPARELCRTRIFQQLIRLGCCARVCNKKHVDHCQRLYQKFEKRDLRGEKILLRQLDYIASTRDKIVRKSRLSANFSALNRQHYQRNREANRARSPCRYQIAKRSESGIRPPGTEESQIGAGNKKRRSVAV
mmetsp:Transcript_21313/g.52166  ORF Transcript_21313/g.52166 Transcript_21313/m.52166 type:complete len:165 (+) Transcript_21313:58-552(+)